MSDQAVKIFEALSDVDQELLERCEQKGSRKNAGVYGLYRRYGKAMAACICLIVAGAVSWGGYQLITGSGSDSSGAASAELSNMAQSMTAADREADGGENTAGSEGKGTETAGGVTGSALDGADTSAASDKKFGEGAEAEQDTDEVHVETATASDAPSTTPIEDSKQQIMQGLENQMSADKVDRLKESELALSDSRREIPWEEACATAPFNNYLPTVLPAGYEAFSARRSSSPDTWDNVIFKWTDGDHILFLDMTQGEVVTREEIERRDGLWEYLAEDFRKEQIPQIQPADEPISFTLYYADGMRIGFSGYITADEMWEVVESISK